MPEQYVLHYQLRAPTAGYTYRCIPNGPSYRYLPAVKTVFPAWATPAYSVIDEYRHGSMLQGGRVLGQRSVTHSALKGEVVFELPSLPIESAGAIVRLGSSLTYGKTAHFGHWSKSGVLRSDNSVVAPYIGTWNSTVAGLYALKNFEYSLPYVFPVGYTLGEIGYKYSGYVKTAKAVSYLVHNRNWQAKQGSSGAWITAGGYREEWSVSVTWDDTGFHGRCFTTLRETVVAYRGALVWSTAAALRDDWDFAENKIAKVTSSAPGASMLPIINFDIVVQGARLWASKDLYEVERIQVHNDALDSYRALRSNNVENAVQMQKIGKLLPVDAAQLLIRSQREIPAHTKLLKAKAIASLYLWWKYVATTTYNDINDLVKALPTLYPKEGPTDLKAKTGADREYEFPNFTWVAETIRVSPYNLTLLPLRLGVHPGLAQAWDLVPFSFVVDWFMGISNQLNAIDWFIYKTFMKLHYLINARKTKVTIDASAFGGAGEVEVSFYVRTISLAWPGFEDSIPWPRRAPIKNWCLAAAALAISNKKLKFGTTPVEVT